jgi:hypothetical protein
VVDEGFGPFGLGPAPAHRVGDDVREVVDIVQVDVVEVVDRRLDIAGNGDVDEEEAPALARAHRSHGHLARDDEPLGRRARHDDVGAHERPLELLPRTRRPTEIDGELLGPLGASVHHLELGPLFDEELGGGFGHLAGAEQERSATLEIAEDLAREIDRHARHRDLARADRGLGAHALGDVERAAHRALEVFADAAVRLGGLEGVLHLPEDLRFADDQRVERRGHAEKVADGVFVEVRAEVARHAGRTGLIGELGDDALDVARGGDGVAFAVAPGDGVDLGAVAGRDAESLFDRGPLEERSQEPRNGVGVDAEPLADLEGRFAVRKSDDDDQKAPPMAPTPTVSIEAECVARPAGPRTR